MASDVEGEIPVVVQKFAIPKSEPQSIYVNQSGSSDLAKREFMEGFERDDWEDKSRRRDSSLRYWLRIGLFVIVIGMNIWWDANVLKMFGLSGTLNSNFHLADSVLIALATTSVANFLALIIIVAKHLYPSTDDRDKKA